MPWVRFTAPFHFRPSPNVWQTFAAGEERNVTTACAKAAVGQHKARRIQTPRRES